MLGTALDESIQRINALKNALAFVVNATAALFYIVFADPAWAAVGLIAGGSVLGGYAGASLGRRLRPGVLRAVVVVVGLVAVVQLVVQF